MTSQQHIPDADPNRTFKIEHEGLKRTNAFNMELLLGNLLGQVHLATAKKKEGGKDDEAEPVAPTPEALERVDRIVMLNSSIAMRAQAEAPKNIQFGPQSR